MLAHRLRHWSNITSMLKHRLGICYLIIVEKVVVVCLVIKIIIDNNRPLHFYDVFCQQVKAVTAACT